MKTTDTTPARSTFAYIAEMVENYRLAVNNGDGDDDETMVDDHRDAILESPLSVRVRSGWVDAGSESKFEPEEFEILMSTGGPAVRIRGVLNDYREPESARIQWQDWNTPWTQENTTVEEDETLLEFCRVFYFGE